MVDKVARFVIELAGEDGDIATVLSALKSKFRQTVSEIEATTRNIELFKGLQEKLAATAVEGKKATDAIVALNQKIELLRSSGQGVDKELVKQMESLQRAAANVSKEYQRTEAQLAKVDDKLRTAGVDTKNLAAEEIRLAEAAKQANAALVEQANKSLLGFKGLSDIKPRIAELNGAFLALRDSGKLSFGELSVANARLQQQIAAVRTQAGGLGQAFTDIRGRLLAIAVAFGGITAGVAGAARDFREFRQQVAAVDSIADVSKAKIDQLAAGVREMAKVMGVDAVQSTRALYEIISSGIPADNALEVLEQSTRAAIAGLTDVDTAARVGVAVLNGYGLQVSQLGHVYDVLFQTVKDGVVTFPELAKNIGQVIPAARAAHVPIEELGAAFVVLTRQGIDAPEAATAINRAIIDLSAPAPEAAQRLRALGIDLRGLVGTIEQFASRKLTLGQLAEIIPDVRAQRAVLALATNFQLLTESLTEMSARSGQAQAAYLKLADTPQQQVARFNAAMKDLGISIGDFVTGTGGAVTGLTSLVNSFNALGPTTKSTVIQFVAIAAGATALVVVAKQLVVPLNLLAGALGSIGTGGLAAAEGLTAAQAAAGLLKVGIAGLLGFKLGELLRENFAPVRRLGDELGLVAAAAANLGEFGFARLRAALSGNRAAADQATLAYRRNRDIIETQWNEAISGATERLRALDVQQRQLVTSLAKTSQAAADSAAAVESSITRIVASVTTQLAAADKTIGDLQQSLRSLSASLAQSVQAVQASATSQLAEVNARTSAALADQALLQQKEIANLLATVEIQRKAANERLLILQKFAKDSIAAFESEAKARIEIAKRTGEDVRKVEADLAVARRDVLQKIVDAYRAHYNDLVGQEQAHLDKIKSIQEQRVALNQSIEDKVRELQRGTLTAYEQRADRIAQIDELLSKARIAVLKGDTKAAEEFANKAIGLVDGISGEVREGEKVIISGFNASTTAVDRLREAQDILNVSIGKREAAEKQGAAATKEAAAAAKGQIADVTKQLQDAQQTASEGIHTKVDLDVAGVKTTIEQLDQAIETRERVVKVRGDLSAAQIEIKRLKEDLEQGITVNVQARTEKIQAALKSIDESNPELHVDVDKALAAIGEVIKAAKAIDAIRVEIDTNIADVRKEIDSLNGRDTKSTHTIKIVVDRSGVPSGIPIDGVGPPAPGFARGGLVGWSLERQADGVPVQRFGSGGTVAHAPAARATPAFTRGGTVQYFAIGGPVKHVARRYFGGALQRIDRSAHNVVDASSQVNRTSTSVAGDTTTSERHDTTNVRRYATGGPVFRAPSWQKVPGSGRGDTVPAALQAGSYVVRKDAVTYYGDDVLTRVAGAVQNFSRGGDVQHLAIGGGINILQGSGVVAQKLLATGKPPGGVAGAALGHGDPELHAVILQAYKVIQPLLDQARTLRHSSTAQNIDAYLARVLELIQNSQTADEAKGFLEPVLNDLASLKGGIEQARRWNVPLVFGAFTDKGPSLTTTNIAAEASKSGFGYTDPITGKFVRWFDAGSKKLTGQTPRFAQGGDVGGTSTDTVPAMLTPGEWVMRPRAVQHFGTRFMEAINSLRVPRAALAGMLATATPAPAVAHFAMGGPVGNVADARTSAAAPGGSHITLNINASADAILSKENAHRLLYPILEDALRKSGRR